MQITQRIAPCLWFDSQAEEAAAFYVSVFKNSKITKVNRYPNAGQETHKQRPGSVMTVAFELDGQPFTALNAGPLFKFNEAVSLQINCSDQLQQSGRGRPLLGQALEGRRSQGAGVRLAEG